MVIFVMDACLRMMSISLIKWRRYKNGVQVAYSLTTYSPYEGYRIAFNGTKGRLEAWIQESRPTSDVNFDELVLFKNFGKREYIQIPFGTSGHGGGDARSRFFYLG